LLRTGNNRGEARAVLIAVLCFVLALALLQGSAFLISDPKAFSQGSPTPSPTGPRIQFLNPSAGTSRELSTKDDGTNQTYHLVAWVSEVPPNPLVEFKYQPTGGGETTISGSGTVIQSGDTFELPWNMAEATNEATDSPGPIPTEGTSGTLRAILYSGSTEISRDEETVRVNQQAAPACPGSGNETCEEEAQANTVELTYPTNAGSKGWYRPNPGQGPNNSVFDATSSTGTETIKSFYTLSRPGTEPEWKQCRSGADPASETKANSADGVRCEYASADNPASVTAVAVRADDSLPRVGPVSDPDQDTSDAHRTFPYEQDATSVVLTNGQQTTDPNKCTAVITATVLDQASPARKIADTNVDVHAAGTVDELFFDDSDGTPPYSAPNKAPENHPTEAAADCETTTNPPNSGTQGEHEIAGPGDTKHIESSTDTDDSGSWKFALLARVAATAQFVVFADEDSNDRLCSAEAQANGSAGWGSAAPGPTGFSPEDTVCPRPGPTGSPSPTPTPTRSPTQTGSPSPTPTESRTITIVASRGRVTFGTRVRLSGQIFADDEACEDGEFVRVRRRIHGRRSSVEFKTTTTDENGRYDTDIIVRRNADYRTLVNAHDNCGDAQSSPVTIQAKVKIKLKASDRTPTRGSRLRLKVTVKPPHRGTKVVLQRKKGRRFVKVDTARLGRKGVIIFSLDANFKKRQFRAKWRGQDRDHEGNNSKRVKVKTHR
jgi:hypothetical protein